MSLKCILQGQTLQPSDVLPKSPGTAAIGSSTLYARADHVHPHDDTKLDKSGGTMTGSLVLKSDPEEDLEAATKQYVDNHTVSAMVYEELPAKPTTPIGDDEEIPYTWEQINTITLAGKAQEYFSLGSTKLVNLSAAVLGANAATMTVIGFDQDGENTVTFQTKGSLPTRTPFGSSNAIWIGSTVRTQCQNFYNACEAKDFIKIVSKGTCSNYGDRNQSVTYNDETVWLPSEREMGLDSYSPLSTANSITSKAECTQGYNVAYSYYTSNTTRVKYVMNANGTLTTTISYYWERSRYYSKSGYDCYVTNNGVADYTNYNVDRYIAPAFVIGNGTPSAKITQDGEDITNKIAGVLNSAKIAAGSYIGTGTAGVDSPCILPFNFKPRCLFLLINNPDNYINLNSGSTPSFILNETEKYALTTYSSFSNGSASGYGYHKLWITWGEDSVSFYTNGYRTSTNGTENTGYTSATATQAKAQFNTANTEYYYIAIG